LGQTNNVIFKAQVLTNLGAYYATVQDFISAKNYFNQALALRIKINHRKGILESYYNLGSLAYMQNDFEDAENIFFLGLERAKKAAFISDQIDFLEMLVEIQKETKNKDKEIEYYRNYLDLKDENQVKLLKNQEENALLVDFFEVKKSEALQLPVTNQFWTGILIGSGGMLLCLILLNLIFKNKETLLFTKRYDE
jgi:tetratricopeptide (TPR) repeat protein